MWRSGYEGILYDLNNAIKGTCVEPLIYTAEELDSMKERPFIAKALKEGIALYEQNSAPALSACAACTAMH